jgi:Zn-dependent M16 (insulinase) family peptidase
MSKEYKINQQLDGFTIKNITEVKELNLDLIELVHDKTGARMIHLKNDDPENLFAVAFRTPPSDSTGVAHILEHTALCGSKNYPVRDPFFSMIKRSLNTFMNAMTASDWTMYPFASQNEKDFYNLMGIYLDAAFFPNLREMDFKQEGHRLEFSEIDNPESDLEYKGVVYNEMKGAMTDPTSLLGRRLEKALYTKTCYHHNSGGEPSEIPNLTHKQLVDFHKSYYHPSNSWFCTYGNFNLEKHLEFINTKVLNTFEKLDIDSSIPVEPKINKNIKVVELYPLDVSEDLNKKSMVQIAWLTNDICNAYETLSLSVLESLLLGNPAAPLYKALLDSGLGSNLAPYTGYHDDNRTAFFAAGLQGCNEEDADKIEKIVLDTLKKVAEEGFTEERIEGVIHRIELTHKEVVGDGFPYGLLLLFKMFAPYMHNNDAVSQLKIDENLSKLRSEVKDDNFFKNMIHKYLLDNSHRVTLILKPEHGLQEKEDLKVKEKLQKIKDSLTEEEKKKIIQDSLELVAAQEAEDDLSVLPTLEIEDIPIDEDKINFEEENINSLKVFKFDAPTNGIGYFNASFKLNGISKEDLYYLPIFCTLLTQVGTEKYDYIQMAERKEAGTGGIDAMVSILENPADINDYQLFIKLKGKALVQKQDKLFEILKDICLSADFNDLERIKTVIGQVRISMENSIHAAGHSFAMKAGAAQLTPLANLKEIFTGISQIKFIKKLTELSDDELKNFSEKMKYIADTVFSNMFYSAVAVEKDNMSKVLENLKPFINSFEFIDKEDEFKLDFNISLKSLGFAVSTPVSYVSRTFKTTDYKNKDSAPLTVLSKILRAGYLHREIREKGGAYGGMCSYQPKSGILSLLSYRDPNLERTINVYEDAVNWAARGEFTDEDIKEAILSVFSDIDKPLSPSGKAMSEYIHILQGLTYKERLEFRKNLIGVTKDDIVKVANMYLKEKFNESVVSVISNKSLLDDIEKKMPMLNWDIKQV